MNTNIKKSIPANELVFKAKPAFLAQNGGDETAFFREAGFAKQAIEKNRSILNCSPESVVSAIKNLALTGLTLNPTINLAYLVPRGRTCTLAISFMGMIEILRNSGSIKNMRAGVIYDGDEYEIQMGTNGYLKHSPKLTPGKTKLAAYAIAMLPNGEEIFHIMNWNDIMKRKAKAMSKNVWNQWEDEMAQKTVIRAFYKFLPKTPEANEMMSIIDDQANQEYAEEATQATVIQDENI